ncbi:MAG: alcohol dehydrogenase [Candidatus Syntrophoarchaeum sp. WYZ-LMO15]|nr:MAG: alcohol dehydrogenase [Candidatus Syntrophoarchaeum sp. WYZ-LMO15]
MKAAVLRQIGDLRVEEVDTPQCGRGEVLIRVESCGICRTDLKMYREGQRDLRLPRILGHEVTGTVVEVGHEVRGVFEGDRIQVAPGFSCGRCRFCLQGMFNICDNISILGFDHDGGFSDYLLLPEEAVRSGCLNPIPSNLSFNEATLAEPVACCINGLERAGVNVGDTALIIGGGVIGNIFYHLLRLTGASRVFVVETSPNRREFMRKNRIEALESVESVQEGVDILIPACSDPSALIEGMKMVKKRGKVILFSGLSPSPHPMVLDPNLIHYNELLLTGAYGCTQLQNRKALWLMAEGGLDLGYLITDRVPLHRILDGLRMVEERRGMKVVVG